MTRPTGNPPGRPPGAKNKRTKALADSLEAASRILATTLPGAFAGDSHAFLMSIYKDPRQPIELRLDAAKAAIRFEKPALASVDVKAEHEHVVHVIRDEPLSAEEWEAVCVKH